MIKKQAEADISTDLGEWHITAYANHKSSYVPHLALSHLPLLAENEDTVLVRIHSECITGDLFGSTRCDCGEQLQEAMKLVSQKGGIIIYLRQEGRGIGLINKLKAYNLQDKGADTIDANTMLGHHADERSYDIAVEILKDLSIKKIDLLTNNPDKLDAFLGDEIELRHRIPLIISPRKENEQYLKTKESLMGHLLG
jgi:3,4-dihydroxy 2-butanone 4-phosphate synthase/GTP cyclohydrolase II